MRIATVRDARRLVEDELQRLAPLPDDEWMVLAQETIEKPWGWVFFYTSRKFHETGEFRYAIAGNAPFIVEKQSGRVLVTGTAKPVQHYIDNYERTGNPHGCPSSGGCESA